MKLTKLQEESISDLEKFLMPGIKKCILLSIMMIKAKAKSLWYWKKNTQKNKNKQKKTMAKPDYDVEFIAKAR